MSPEARHKIRQIAVIFCGEFIGISFLMIYGCTGINEKHLNTTHAALAWAFTVTSIVTVFGHLTMCHINPCVTVCFVILGFVGPFTALIYFAAEFLGAIFGFYVALVLTRNSLLNNVTTPDTGFCLTQLSNNVSVFHGALCEFIATSLLIFAVCSITDRRNAMWGDSIPIKIGLTVGVLVFGAGPLTGASMNPARSFAPALLYRKWKNHWVYWVSPFGGSICTSLLYKYLFVSMVEDEAIFKISNLGSDAVKSGALVVDVQNQKSSIKIRPSDESSQLKTEIAIQEDTAFVSNKLQ